MNLPSAGGCRCRSGQPQPVEPDYVYEGMATFNQWVVPSNLDAFGNPRFNPDLPRSPFYDTPILFQSPRSVQVGFKFTF